MLLLFILLTSTKIVFDLWNIYIYIYINYVTRLATLSIVISSKLISLVTYERHTISKVWDTIQTTYTCMLTRKKIYTQGVNNNQLCILITKAELYKISTHWSLQKISKLLPTRKYLHCFSYTWLWIIHYYLKIQ